MATPEKTLKTSFPIPRWIVYYSIFLFALSFSMAIVGYINPKLVFGEVNNADAESAFYAARNLAFGFMLGFALWKKSSQMLGILVAGRFVVETADLLATLTYGLLELNPLVIAGIWISIFLLPELYAAKYLLSKQRT